jgi:hypothetical protein
MTGLPEYSPLDNENYPIYCKLHGDFRYESIKNLTSDLAAQNKELGQCLVNACNRFGLIVTGYSGRDASVMELLTSVLSTPNPFPHGLFWTGLRKSSAPASVRDFIDAGKKRGVKAEYVEIETFDAFLLRLWRNTEGKPGELDAKVRRHQHTKVSIPVPPPGSRGIPMRLNAVSLSLPNKCSRVKTRQPIDWKPLYLGGHESRLFSFLEGEV